jgi:hypothetical protein
MLERTQGSFSVRSRPLEKRRISFQGLYFVKLLLRRSIRELSAPPVHPRRAHMVFRFL